MNKKQYQQPAMEAVALHQQQQLLQGSSTSSGGPSADFMSNPNVAEEE